MKSVVLLIAAMTFSGAAVAAGIDSRGYTCAGLQALIAARGFVFIAQPAFGDFVVSNPSYCGGGEVVQLRSVPTADAPECPVYYCVSRQESERF